MSIYLVYACVYTCMLKPCCRKNTNQACMRAKQRLIVHNLQLRLHKQCMSLRVCVCVCVCVCLCGGVGHAHVITDSESCAALEALHMYTSMSVHRSGTHI